MTLLRARECTSNNYPSEQHFEIYNSISHHHRFSHTRANYTDHSSNERASRHSTHTKRHTLAIPRSLSLTRATRNAMLEMRDSSVFFRPPVCRETPAHVVAFAGCFGTRYNATPKSPASIEPASPPAVTTKTTPSTTRHLCVFVCVCVWWRDQCGADACGAYLFEYLCVHACMSICVCLLCV